MKSPFLTKMRKKNCEVIRKNMNLGQFKDHIVQFLSATRMINGEIVDIEFGLPSKGVVPLEIFIKKVSSADAKKEKVEDQVDKKKSGKKRS